MRNNAWKTLLFFGIAVVIAALLFTSMRFCLLVGEISRVKISEVGEFLHQFESKLPTVTYNHPILLLSLGALCVAVIVYLLISRLAKYLGSEEIKEADLNKKRKRLARLTILVFGVATLGAGYVFYIVLRLLINEMAKDNILVTFRTDGEIKAVMRGEECVRYIVKIENHRIDPWGFDVFQGSLERYAEFLAKAAKKKEDDPGFKEIKLKTNGGRPQLRDELVEAIKETNSSTLLEELFGVVWVGLPPYRIFTYRFRWMKYGQKKAEKGVPSAEVSAHPRDEKVDSLFFRYPQYAIVLTGLETGAGSLAEKLGTPETNKEGAKKEGAKTISQVQVKAVLVFETKTTNPQKTLFRTAALSSAGDWQQALVREISDRARMWIGQATWDTLRQDEEEVKRALAGIAKDINGVDADDLTDPKTPAISSVRDYGQKIITITMPRVDLEDRTLQEAYENVIKAERLRDADKASAEGKRALAAAPVQGEADGLKLISEIRGGKEMYIAKQVGNIRVYAPGSGQNLLLSVSDEPAETPPEADKK